MQAEDDHIYQSGGSVLTQVSGFDEAQQGLREESQGLLTKNSELNYQLNMVSLHMRVAGCLGMHVPAFWILKSSKPKFRPNLCHEDSPSNRIHGYVLWLTEHQHNNVSQWLVWNMEIAVCCDADDAEKMSFMDTCRQAGCWQC